MFRDHFAAIRRQVSGRAARDDVAAIVCHHRIQASPGYRAAAQYVLAGLEKAGLDCWIESFPADLATRFWTASSFQEWEATAATLELVQPAEHACKLADLRDCKISLIQRSVAFDGVAEVVLLPDGSKEEDYQGIDLTGKVVLCKGQLQAVTRLAVDKYGAAGILYYGMGKVPPVRESMDLPDALQYTSFWWSADPDQEKCFGFVLSPRRGEWLADLVRNQAREGKPPVQVRARVDSRLYDGALEVVCARIPGESQDEAVMVAHLCHPQPSANDNASGAAAALEAARSLHTLLSRGELPRPRRGIRFLWVPEMSGTYAYLSTHEELIPHMIAGINLDMVGGYQSHNGSSFVLERPPDACSSFVPALLERLREELFYDAFSHTGLARLPLFAYATTGFSGGSDHYIFSDPTVGVPMPMLIQDPDKFYHTSADTIEHIDPAMLARAASLAAGLVYFVASAGPDETAWLGTEMAARFEARLAEEVQALVTGLWEGETRPPAKIEARVTYLLARHHEALDTLERLWAGAGPLAALLAEQADELGQAQCARVRQAIEVAPRRPATDDHPADAGDWETLAATFVPRRLYRGPLSAMLREWQRLLPAEERGDWPKLIAARPHGGWTLPVLADYWADGRRSALEIVDLVEHESGIRDPELVVRRFELLEKVGLVERLPVRASQPC